VSAVQRAGQQAQRAEQQRLRAQDLAQRKERQQQQATLDRIRLEIKKLEMRRKVSSPLTDEELLNLVGLENALGFQFPLSPDERAQGAKLHSRALQAQQEAEAKDAALIRQQHAAAEMSRLHEVALRMNSRSRLMREHGGLVVTVIIGVVLLVVGYVVIHYVPVPPVMR
jgi:hypothetical protein